MMPQATEPTGKPRNISADRQVITTNFAPATEYLKVKTALIISSGGLAVGVLFLGLALYVENHGLQTWAMGLISLVVGAAIGYVFGGTAPSGDG